MGYRPYRAPGDELARPFVPRREPLTIPSAGIFDAPTVCLELNTQWASHVLGAFEVLLQDDSWLGDAEERYNAIVQVEQLTAFLIVGVGCLGGMQLRIDPENACIIQQFDEVSSLWVTFFDATVCAVPGPAGPQGEPGQDGADGDQINAVVANTLAPGSAATAAYAAGTLTLGIPRGATGATGTDGSDGSSVEMRLLGNWVQWRQSDDSPSWANLYKIASVVDETPGTDGTDKRCNIASYAVESVLPALVNEVIIARQTTSNYIELVGILLFVGAAVLGTVASGGLLAFAIGAATLAGGGISLANWASGMDLTTFQNELTPAWWEEVRCALYKAIPETGVINQAALAAAVSEISGTESKVGLQLILESLSDDQLNLMLIQGALYEPSVSCAQLAENCPPEPETWAIRIDFRNASPFLEDWFGVWTGFPGSRFADPAISTTYNVWSSGLGLVGSGWAQTHKPAGGIITFSDTQTITSVLIVHTYADRIAEQQSGIIIPIATTVNVPNVTELRIAAYGQNTGYIQYVDIHGTGIPPSFGTPI